MLSGQTAADLGEYGGEFGAERAHGADDGDGDQTGDETIFDRRDARLIVDKTVQQMTHDSSP